MRARGISRPWDTSPRSVWRRRSPIRRSEGEGRIKERVRRELLLERKLGASTKYGAVNRPIRTLHRPRTTPGCSMMILRGGFTCFIPRR